jgi:hypothetical protein
MNAAEAQLEVASHLAEAKRIWNALGLLDGSKK